MDKDDAGVLLCVMGSVAGGLGVDGWGWFLFIAFWCLF